MRHNLCDDFYLRIHFLLVHFFTSDFLLVKHRVTVTDENIYQ